MMTPWELQLCANAAGKSMSVTAWLTAALHRSKKMPELGELTRRYDPKLDGDVEQDIAETSLLGMLNRMADTDEVKGRAKSASMP